MAKVTLTNGNKEVTLSVVSFSEWASGDRKRVYYKLECTGKRDPIGSLYEILGGETKDQTVTVNGRKFGYQYGVDANSATKRAAIDAAVVELVSALI